MANPQPDSSPTAHLSNPCQDPRWVYYVLVMQCKDPAHQGHALVLRTLRRMVKGTLWELVALRNNEDKYHIHQINIIFYVNHVVSWLRTV